MKAKGKRVWAPGRKLGLPAVFLSCIFFFLAGFFGSTLLSPDISSVRTRPRLLESVEEETFYNPMPHGETGETSVASVPLQIMKMERYTVTVVLQELRLEEKEMAVKVFECGVQGSRGNTYKQGHKRNMITSGDNVITQSLKVLSWKPRALYFPKFATAEQCQSIIKMAKPNLTPSTLALREGETTENTKGVRTSSGTFISASEDKTGILDIIEQKIARVTMIPRSHGEAFNILRYEIGQGYQSHYDALNPTEYGQQKSQRIASFLLYLSDVKEGGETIFPYENGFVDFNYDYKKCTGLKVKPHQGDGLLFYSLFPNGTIDPASLHGSCPVIEGEKWVATKWIRDQEEQE